LWFKLKREDLVGKKLYIENVFILLFMYVFALAFIALGAAMTWGASTGKLDNPSLAIVIGIGMFASGVLVLSYPVVTKLRKKRSGKDGG